VKIVDVLVELNLFLSYYVQNFVEKALVLGKFANQFLEHFLFALPLPKQEIRYTFALMALSA